MKIINASYEIIDKPLQEALLHKIESAARTCYQSHDSTAPLGNLTKHLIERGHDAMLEFASLTVRFITSRGITHELVRHRLCNFGQESSRYCNYSKQKFGSEITVIKPSWFDSALPEQRTVWEHALICTEVAYFLLLNKGLKAQEARGVLPNDLKTEIVVQANVREWRHILKLRCSPAAHPDMINLMSPLLIELQKDYPELFGDIHLS